MQLFVYITNHHECIAPLMNELMARGIRGATSVECQGMLAAVNEADCEHPPIFS